MYQPVPVIVPIFFFRIGRKHSQTSCCSLGTSLAILGLVILTAIVGALAAFTYTLKMEMDKMKESKLPSIPIVERYSTVDLTKMHVYII